MSDRSPTPDPLSRVAVAVIALVAGFTALKLAEDVLAPLTLALVAGIILAPAAAMLERILPRSAVAALLPALGLVGLFALAFLVEPLIGRVIDAWPQIRWELRGVLNDFRGLVQQVGEVNDDVTSALGGGDGNSGGDDAKATARAIPSLADALFLAPRLAAQMMIFLGALFFFLLTRDRIYAWTAERIGRTLGAEAVLARIRTAEWLVSRYFLAITLVNAGLGFAVAVALSLIGMPGAVAWGVAAALLNFVVYLGPAAMIGALLIGGMIAFDGVGSILPPAIFLALNMIEAQFVTPGFVARHIAINPLLVFISLVFWLWLWGPIGGVIAIPVLVIALAMLNAFDRPLGQSLAPGA
ncbi:AI-2E family transporter [Rhodovulum marinum]|uniref:Putative PurR-regulated permease PerM n=1 Tax=Rhodovulum marinum TaxID=320662 RepID=A0A4R2Q3T0_9RHOB|nr:AI-2E family transporter [Rhodovulum marinum]TCP43069.1 putative PurR-regulated permease PerM [Rhodovulum marinum]